jgi:hypothetical protein
MKCGRCFGDNATGQGTFNSASRENGGFDLPFAGQSVRIANPPRCCIFESNGKNK